MNETNSKSKELVVVLRRKRNKPNPLIKLDFDKGRADKYDEYIYGNDFLTMKLSFHPDDPVPKCLKIKITVMDTEIDEGKNGGK